MGTWNGSALQTRYSQKFGLTDTTSLARVLEWMNEIQEDICTFPYPFLKFRMKKYIASGEQEVNLSPQIPDAPGGAISAGGSLTSGSTYYVKVCFLIYGEDLQEVNSLESQPSAASSVFSPSSTNLTISLTGIDTMDGLTTVTPTNIYRRIYLKKDSGAYYYYSTISNNTATTTTITADVSSTIEPPEYSLIQGISEEDSVIKSNGVSLKQESLDKILKYDPGLTATGTPNYYARISKTKILLYPKPSAAFTLLYYVYRKPSRIFADSDRAIQLDSTVKKVLDAGVTWKGYEYKDKDGQESKLSNYAQLNKLLQDDLGYTGGVFGTVKEVT